MSRPRRPRPSAPAHPPASRNRIRYAHEDAHVQDVDAASLEVRGQLFLWAWIVSEAFEQTAVVDLRLRQKATERYAFLSEHYPGTDETLELEKRLARWNAPVRCTLEYPFETKRDSLVLALTAQRGEWPDQTEASVRFSLCQRARVVFTDKGLPGIASGHGEARAPSNVDDARVAARDLVSTALAHLVTFTER